MFIFARFKSFVRCFTMSEADWAGDAIVDVLQHHLLSSGYLTIELAGRARLVCKRWTPLVRTPATTIHSSDLQKSLKTMAFSKSGSLVLFYYVMEPGLLRRLTEFLSTHTEFERFSVFGDLRSLNTPLHSLLTSPKLVTLKWTPTRHSIDSLIECTEKLRFLREIIITGSIQPEFQQKFFDALSCRPKRQKVTTLTIRQSARAATSGKRESVISMLDKLAAFLGTAKFLRKFSLQTCGTEDSLLKIVRALRDNGMLEEIDLSLAILPQSVLRQLRKALKKNLQLRHFSVEWYRPHSSEKLSLRDIVSAIGKLPLLQSFEISRIPSPGASLAPGYEPALISCKNLTRLKLVAMDGDDILALGKALAQNHSILALTVSWRSSVAAITPPQPAVAPSFFDFLGVNTTLRSLSTAYSPLSQTDAKSLARVLPINNTLGLLNLSHCIRRPTVEDEARQINRYLCRGLRKSQTLTHVSLRYFRGDILHRMVKVISRTRTIAFLNLSGCPLFETDMEPIAAALRLNSSILNFKWPSFTKFIKNVAQSFEPIRAAFDARVYPIPLKLPIWEDDSDSEEESPEYRGFESHRLFESTSSGSSSSSSGSDSASSYSETSSFSSDTEDFDTDDTSSWDGSDTDTEEES